MGARRRYDINIWLVKADTRLPLVFAAVLAALLAFRLPLHRRPGRFWAEPSAAGTEKR